MRKSMLVGAAAAALMVLGSGLAACGDSGGSSSSDTMGGDTTFVPNDTTQTTNTTDTMTATDTTTATDTMTATDTETATDTSTATDTTQTQIPRQCTDDELNTLNTCLAACPDVGGESCAQACFGGLSTGCNAAYSAFIQCIQANSCFNADNTLDATCAAEKCPDQVAGVFGSGVEPSDCNPVTNDGCTAQQTCTLIDNDNNLGCAPAGTVATGGDCTNDLCAKGACLAADASGTTGACYEFCDPMNNTCPDSRPCNVGLTGTDYTFCGDIPTACDVFAQDCGAGKGCYFVDQQGNTDCAQNNGKGAGESCQYINDCAAGFMCAGSGASGTCMAFCNTDGSVACSAGTCTSIGVDTVGVCVTQ